MSYCAVYESVQQKLFSNLKDANPPQCDILNKQILMNVIVLVQLYKFIENGERYSNHDINWCYKFNFKDDKYHHLGYTVFGCDDFLIQAKRKNIVNGVQ